MRELAAQHGLDERFPQAVTEQVTGWTNDPGIDDTSLTDWTGMPFVTIDGPGTRDLDQALCVFANNKGLLRLFGMIALNGIEETTYDAASDRRVKEMLGKTRSYSM